MVKLSQYNNLFKKVVELEQALGIERCGSFWRSVLLPVSLIDDRLGLKEVLVLPDNNGAADVRQFLDS